MNLNPFIDLIASILTFYSWIVIIHIIVIWLCYFDILNRYNQSVRRAIDIFHRLTEPVLSRIRQVIPPIAGIDFSPIILFILIRFVISVLRTYFYTY